MFASVLQQNSNERVYLDDAGFLSQESFHDDGSILPSFPPGSNDLVLHSQELLGIHDPMSDDKDNEVGDSLIDFGGNVDDQLAEGQSKDPAQSLIDDLDRETRELKSLLRSSNYTCGMIDEKNLIDQIRSAQLEIKRKMHAQSNQNKGDEWVSCCPQRSKKTKRFHASKNC